MQSILKTSNNKHRGFTVVELMITMIIMAILTAGFFAVFLQMYRDATRSSQQGLMNFNSQIAMNIIETDIRYSMAFDSTLGSQFTDPYGPSGNVAAPGTWMFAGTDSNHRVLMLEKIAVNSDKTQPVYRSTKYNCSTQLAYNPPLVYTLIYFVHDGTLYRRTLTDTASGTCNGPQYNKQSCPFSPTSTWPQSICQANDEAIVSDVAAFSVNYYTTSDGTASLDIYPDDTDKKLATARTAEVTLTLSNGGSNFPVTTTSTLRATRVNQ